MGASIEHVFRKYYDYRTLTAQIQISSIAFFIPIGALAQIWHNAILFLPASFIICQLKS